MGEPVSGDTNDRESRKSLESQLGLDRPSGARATARRHNRVSRWTSSFLREAARPHPLALRVYADINKQSVCVSFDFLPLLPRAFCAFSKGSKHIKGSG